MTGNSLAPLSESLFFLSKAVEHPSVSIDDYHAWVKRCGKTIRNLYAQSVLKIMSIHFPEKKATVEEMKIGKSRVAELGTATLPIFFTLNSPTHEED
jgi:hypothetical protein